MDNRQYQQLQAQIAAVQTAEDIQRLSAVIKQIPETDPDREGLARTLAQRYILVQS